MARQIYYSYVSFYPCNLIIGFISFVKYLDEERFSNIIFI